MNIAKLHDNLPTSLRAHISRVGHIALEIGRAHSLDLNKIAFAAKYHDLARVTPPELLLTECKNLGIAVGDFEKQLPLLLHGPVAGSWVQSSNDALASPEVVEAIQSHSVASSSMSSIAKVIFLADKLDPHKIKQYPFQLEVSEASTHDLDKALFIFTDREIAMRLGWNQLIHPQSIMTRNYLLKRYGDSVGPTKPA